MPSKQRGKVANPLLHQATVRLWREIKNFCCGCSIQFDWRNSLLEGFKQPYGTWNYSNSIWQNRRTNILWPTVYIMSETRTSMLCSSATVPLQQYSGVSLVTHARYCLQWTPYLSLMGSAIIQLINVYLIHLLHQHVPYLCIVVATLL